MTVPTVPTLPYTVAAKEAKNAVAADIVEALTSYSDHEDMEQVDTYTYIIPMGDVFVEVKLAAKKSDYSRQDMEKAKAAYEAKRLVAQEKEVMAAKRNPAYHTYRDEWKLPVTCSIPPEAAVPHKYTVTIKE